MSTRRPQEFAAFPPTLAELSAFGPYRAVVRHVVDGDTLDVLVDLGFNAYTYQTVRVRDIDCPERNTPGGRDAQAYARGLLPPGTPVVLVTFKDAQTFGRYVADVLYLEPGETHALNLGDTLVLRGMARRVTA